VWGSSLARQLTLISASLRELAVLYRTDLQSRGLMLPPSQLLSLPEMPPRPIRRLLTDEDVRVPGPVRAVLDQRKREAAGKGGTPRQA
jgi:hypothetical protein